MDEKFGPLLAFTDVEAAVLGHYKLWMNLWLAARERHMEMVPETIARPRSYITKQTFTALPGEERTPLVIAVSDGFQTAPDRRGTGRFDALFRFGIAVVCMGAAENKARLVAGHYQAALLGIALKHQAINDGQIRLDEFRDLRIEDIDEEAAGRSLAAVRMELTYRVTHFAEQYDPPIWKAPPDDLLAQPPGDMPEVQTVHIDVNKVAIDAEI